MEYKLSEVLDIENFENLMSNFYNITKVPYGLFDSKCNVISCIAWQDICVNFHKKCESSLKECRKSDYEGIRNAKSGKCYMHSCKNGLIDSFIPISVKGEIIAYLALGQFLFQEPDVEEFINRGKKYKYDIPSYIEALKKVPIIKEKDFKKSLDYFLSVVKMMESHGERYINHKNAEKLLLEEKLKKVQKLNNEVIKKDELLREAREYDRLRTEFFSNLSHELKTPINVIYSALQTSNSFVNNNEIQLSDKKEKLKKYSNIMKQNCFRLIRLTNNILDITKFDSGFLKLELKQCNLVEIVEDITLSVVEYIESTGIEVIFDTEVEEKYIICDPVNIERVLLNLLSNAVKFTGKGGQVLVNIYDKGENVIISVSDTGEGIPIENQENIFERFIRVDKSLSRHHEGSGIGLSLVKAIVELHNGKISVKSKIGCGTKFIITLPSNQNNEEKVVNKIDSYKENSLVEKVKIEFSDIYF
ncbi:hypothetical protein SH2C18_30670 [Clostridium sediminicola]|uniref:PocR ligand-binding domain-containing protein n=1 Tax=Clostridium sediminicola TaxID=3114879 RepID=UPI0031F1D98C